MPISVRYPSVPMKLSPSKNLVHNFSNVMKVLVANLNEEAAGRSEQLASQKQAVAQVN